MEKTAESQQHVPVLGERTSSPWFNLKRSLKPLFPVANALLGMKKL